MRGAAACKEAFPKIQSDERYMRENTGQSRSGNAQRENDDASRAQEFIESIEQPFKGPPILFTSRRVTICKSRKLQVISV